MQSKSNFSIREKITAEILEQLALRGPLTSCQLAALVSIPLDVGGKQYTRRRTHKQNGVRAIEELGNKNVKGKEILVRSILNKLLNTKNIERVGGIKFVSSRKLIPWQLIKVD